MRMLSTVVAQTPRISMASLEVPCIIVGSEEKRSVC